ncbi:MAG: GT4 family glycosyltransferase PelF [bacterium]
MKFSNPDHRNSLHPDRLAQPETDVCLIVEGTYPYVTGGVAAWVHQLLTGLPELTFSLAVILSNRKSHLQQRYTLPSNVKEIRHIYLHDFELPHSRQGKLAKEAWTEVLDFHHCPAASDKLTHFEALYRQFFDPATRGIAPNQILNTHKAWSVLETLYQEKAHEESFIDYFWTCRFIHLPIFKILSTELPHSALYHTLSTGYAGLLAAVAKLKHQRPVLLTEHGIYTRERRLEISRVDWIYEKEDQRLRVQRSQSRFRELWNQMFATLSHICYHSSDRIITLFKSNQAYQIEEGAPRDRLAIIPNAIDVAQFQRLQRDANKDPEQLVIGLMARVVHIKDVKTFIRACKSVAANVRKLKVYIMGPTDEEPAYYDECVRLCEFLGLQSIITFTGKIDVKVYYPKLDILVLTSISEAQPLVILEANCLGIPVVATDVGACREMLYGSAPEDVALGKSGLIAGITNTEEIAQAIIKIWRSRELRETMAEVGKQRVARYYDRSELLRKYRKLYAQLITSRSRERVAEHV